MREVTHVGIEKRAEAMHRRLCRSGCTEAPGLTYFRLAARDLEAEARENKRDEIIAYATLIRFSEIIAGRYQADPDERLGDVVATVLAEVDASIEQFGLDKTFDNLVANRAVRGG